jgi:hypothetical protein
MNRKDQSLIRRLMSAVLLGNDVPYSIIRTISYTSLYDRIQGISLSMSANISMAMLVYVYLTMVQKRGGDTHIWSIYENRGVPIVRGERKVNGATKYKMIISSTTDGGRRESDLDPEEMSPLCSPQDAIDIFNSGYEARHNGISPIPSIGRIDAILSRYYPDSTDIATRLVARGSIYEDILPSPDLDDEDELLVKGDIISYRMMNVYEDVFNRFPNPACYIPPSRTYKKFIPDVDFVFPS